MSEVQAYISPVLANFPFMETFGLRPYTDPREPAVFFGCYRGVDLHAIERHRGRAILLWAGRDIIKFRHNHHRLGTVIDVAFLPSIQEEVIRRRGRCFLAPYPLMKGQRLDPRKKGEAVYAYYQKNGSYGVSGRPLLSNWIKEWYPVKLPSKNKRVSWNLWYDGFSDSYYNVFAGLMLSNYARGATSIADLGLRGIPCVTNIGKFPNALNWKKIDDIQGHLKEQSKKVGTVDRELAEKTYEFLDKKYRWVNSLI